MSGDASPSMQHAGQKSRKHLRISLLFLVLLCCCGLLYFQSPIQSRADLASWNGSGCPTKILDLTATMPTIFRQAGGRDALLADLGNPLERRPRTAIVNMVAFHTEVVAALAYQFVKLRHNVTVYARNDSFDMDSAVTSFHWKGFRKFERFFEQFYEHDNIIIATFPTCHLRVLSALQDLQLPQHYGVTVHTPAMLNSTAVVETLTSAAARVLVIAPHVLTATKQVARAIGLATEPMGWVAPIFPVIYPEECVPGSWKLTQPACRRQNDTMAMLTGTQPADAPLPAAPERQGFCVQGKLDPSRRDYSSIFQEIETREEELMQMNFALVLQGKGGGQKGMGILEIPDRLLDTGLVRTHSSLPFQEYYEVLHSCVAVLPAFASSAYYVDKGSSTIGAALIAGTPLVATPSLLRAYSFIPKEAVYLVDESLSYIDALQGILQLPPVVHRAKIKAVQELRQSLLVHNVKTLQKLFGPGGLLKDKRGEVRDLVSEVEWGGPDTARWEREVANWLKGGSNDTSAAAAAAGPTKAASTA